MPSECSSREVARLAVPAERGNHGVVDRQGEVEADVVRVLEWAQPGQPEADGVTGHEVDRRREHGAGRGGGDPREDVPLDTEILGHGLDDEVRVTDRRNQVRRPGEEPMAIGFVQARPDGLDGVVQYVRLGIVEDHVQAAGRENLRDAASHQPGADDRCPLKTVVRADLRSLCAQHAV